MHSILFISVMNGAAWGGSEELWFQSALLLRKKKYTVGVCCFHWPGKSDKLDQLKDAGCSIYLLEGKNESNSIWGKWKLLKRLKDLPLKNYDKVIVNQGGWKDITHFPFKNLFKKLSSYTLTFHNYDTGEKLSAKRKNLLKAWVANAEVNVGASVKIFDTLFRNYSIDVPRQKILINPITFITPKQAVEMNTIDEKIIFTMLAALDTGRKAQDILINSLAFEKWKDRNWELHLYGEGKDRPSLQKIISDNGLESKIFLKGHTQDVKTVLTGSHLVLQMTKKDAMPISVMEAMALSRPVLVSNTGDMAEWIKDGINGWVCKEVTVEEINITLEKAWQQKEQWAAMGKKSFSIFITNYPEDPAEYFLQQCNVL